MYVSVSENYFVMLPTKVLFCLSTIDEELPSPVANARSRACLAVSSLSAPEGLAVILDGWLLFWCIWSFLGSPCCYLQSLFFSFGFSSDFSSLFYSFTCCLVHSTVFTRQLSCARLHENFEGNLTLCPPLNGIRSNNITGDLLSHCP